MKKLFLIFFKIYAGQMFVPGPGWIILWAMLDDLGPVDQWILPLGTQNSGLYPENPWNNGKDLSLIRIVSLHYLPQSEYLAPLSYYLK